MLKILDFFQLIWNIIKFLFNGLIDIFKIALSGVQFVITLSTSLPTTIALFLVAIVVASVVWKLVSLGGAGE